MKRLCLFFITFCFVYSVSAQNYFRINGTQYPATPTWRMYGSKYVADVLIVKKNDGTGYLIAGVQEKDGWDISYYAIGGLFYIYLSNGGTIKCVDRKRYGSMDGIITNYYNLTKEEITILKNNNITGVMFSIGFYSSYSGTVVDRRSYSASYYGSTKYDVQQLFKENNTIGKTQKTDYSIYTFVDLGLSVKWSTCNVGAKNSEGYGDYFTDSEALKLQKTSYRLPTREECWELLQECRWEWKGNGYKVIGKNGNSIFLPVAGYQYDVSYSRWVGSEGYFWSSSHSGGYSGYNFLGVSQKNKYISSGLGGNDKLSVRFVK